MEPSNTEVTMPIESSSTMPVPISNSFQTEIKVEVRCSFCSLNIKNVHIKMKTC